MKKIIVVGLGPGQREQMTFEAAAALDRCDVIIGYQYYIDSIRDQYPHKKLLATPMRREVERCRMAAQEADLDQLVAMVCSGDAGVYGMAGLVYQVAEEFPQVEVEIIPGVTAALSGAAVLGAPLMHDVCVISLSDLLTPWELIQRRLKAAAEADFAICLYNPSSHKRVDYLQKACDILLESRDGKTVCGIVRNIGREGEESRVMTLSQLRETQVDMFTTVFVGNSCTMELSGNMVTPRGYRLEAKG